MNSFCRPYDFLPSAPTVYLTFLLLASMYERSINFLLHGFSDFLPSPSIHVLPNPNSTLLPAAVPKISRAHLHLPNKCITALARPQSIIHISWKDVENYVCLVRRKGVLILMGNVQWSLDRVLQGERHVVRMPTSFKALNLGVASSDALVGWLADVSWEKIGFISLRPIRGRRCGRPAS